jgi:hypothetical protein
VCQFFEDGSHFYELRWVTMQAAVLCFKALITSVGAELGTTRRVIVTDGGDSINLDWEFGKGITFPPELHGVTPKPRGVKINGSDPGIT